MSLNEDTVLEIPHPVAPESVVKGHDDRTIPITQNAKLFAINTKQIMGSELSEEDITFLMEIPLSMNQRMKPNLEIDAAFIENEMKETPKHPITIILHILVKLLLCGKSIDCTEATIEAIKSRIFLYPKNPIESKKISEYLKAAIRILVEVRYVIGSPM